MVELRPDDAAGPDGAIPEAADPDAPGLDAPGPDAPGPDVTRPDVTRPDVRRFLDFLGSLPGARMHELDASAARAGFRALGEVADLPVGELGAIIDLELNGAAGPIAARLFDPRDHRTPGPVILFMHGGGFVVGDITTHAGVCAEMARMLDLPVVSIDYRLAPEHPWPAAPDDCEAAARALAAGPVMLGRGVTSIIVAGDSAGGNLAVVTAAALAAVPARVPVIAQLLFYPAVDMTSRYPSFDAFADGYLLTRESMTWFDAAYRAEAAHIRTSPIHGDLAALPPALVVTAGLDPLRDQGRAFAAALARAGVTVVFREARGNIHGFITIRKAIPSSVGDVAGALVAARALIEEAEADRVTAQAAGAT